MATFGFSKAIIGIYDENEKVTQEFVIDQKGGSTVDANISNLSPSSQAIYGGDGVWKNPSKGVGNVQVSFTANAIPKNIMDIILGKAGTVGFGHFNKDTQPPQCTFEMMAEDASSGKTTHIAVLNGTFSASAIDLKTNTANQVHSPDKLTFKAEERRSDGETYADAIKDKTFDKDKWEQLVRPKAAPKSESIYNNENTKYDNGNMLD